MLACLTMAATVCMVVTFTATDASSNASTQRVTVNVSDTASPDFTAPADVAVEGRAPDGPVEPLSHDGGGARSGSGASCPAFAFGDFGARFWRSQIVFNRFV